MTHIADTQSRRWTKYVMKTLLSLMLFVQVFAFVLLPRPVDAQLQATTNEMSSVPAIIESVKENSLRGLRDAALGALVQGVSFFMQKLAYDSAQYIASGGKGQSALAFEEGFDKYLARTGKDSVATAVEELGKPYGLNFCQLDVEATAFLQVGLRRLEAEGGGGPNGPDCNWQELKDRWGSEGRNQFTTDDIWNQFNGSFSVKESDFGIAVGAMSKIDRLKVQEKRSAELERIEGDGFKAVSNLISGDIKTPAQVIKKESEALTSKDQKHLTSQQLSGVYASGAAQIFPSVASIFLNTLASSLLDRVMSEGILSGSSNAGGSYSSSNLGLYGGPIQANKERAERAFSFLRTVTPLRASNFNIVSEYSTCTDTENPGLNNCVMDGGLRAAIEQSRQEPVTIQEALFGESQFLEPNKPLISPRSEKHGDVQYCWQDAFCYSNLQKMRRVRILPLGFEIAALKSNPDNPWTLGDVVKGFDDCRYDVSGNVIPDPTKPFCHLIDPNWVIKVPDARCEAQVHGPTLLSSSGPQRKQECVNIATKILSTAANGNQVANYGYCTKEKNTWNIPGKSCEPYQNTCTTYRDSNNQFVSYLSRTLDNAQCSEASVGCRTYVTEQDADGNWIASSDPNTGSVSTKALGNNGQIQFNERINSQGVCRADVAGCTAFYQANVTYDEFGDFAYTKATDKRVLNLQKAPSYLGCYDSDQSTEAIEWPMQEQDLNGLSGNAACGDYAQVCLPDEVGCASYTDLGDPSAPAVPGIVGQDNLCSASCVGYDAFAQIETQFEPRHDPVYFIPSAADGCQVQHTGCSEFTSLEDESLRYYSNIKYCEEPTEDESNIKTFYSWEGSDIEGYKLRVHRLKPIDQTDRDYIVGNISSGSSVSTTQFEVGSPAYADKRHSVIEENYADCNATNYTTLIEEGFTHPDAAEASCRALYDDAGNIYYRLVEQTVTVDAACEPLRKTETVLEVDTSAALGNETSCLEFGGRWSEGQCQVCKGGGTYVDTGTSSYCEYNAMTGDNESTTCPAEQNQCRMYVGNTAGNVEEVFADGFENGTISNWNTGASLQIVAESTQVGGHGLRVPSGANAARTVRADKMRPGSKYTLSFWARGAVQQVSVAMDVNGNATSFGTVSLGQEWQQYRIGPVDYNVDATTTTIAFDGAGGDYFIDNVRLIRPEGRFPLIKNSWQSGVTLQDGRVIQADAPAVCDANPLDEQPGAALGCRSYERADGQAVNVTGFQNLCREEALGCQPVFDSQNTLTGPDAARAKVYQLRCDLGSVATQSSECTVAFASTTESCTVTQGENSCYIDEFVIPDGETVNGSDGLEGVANATITASTIVVPADSENAIYLTVREEFQCGADQRGCQAVGLEEQVLPEDSATTSFSHTTQYVLNNPDNYIGNDGILCENEQVGCDAFQAGNSVSYFKDPTIAGKLCSYAENVNVNGVQRDGWFMDGVGRCEDADAALCRTSEDCASGVSCNTQTPVACYQDYLTAGGNFGIKSNGSSDYAGFAGQCAQEANGCTEYVDPADTTAEGAKSYYVIENNELRNSAAECTGQVSLKEGCVLFDRPSVPNQNYDSATSYQRSAAQNDALVAPISTENNDADIILKVDRDRQCSEWLSCARSQISYNDNGESVEVCSAFQYCREFAGDEKGACSDPVDTQNMLEPFTESNYVTRDTGWYGEEYSGYSLYNRYPIPNYVSLSVEGSDEERFLAYSPDPVVFVDTPELGCTVGPAGRSDESTDGLTCGFDQNGLCYNQRCLYPVDAQEFSTLSVGVTSTLVDTLTAGVCKAYPEETSPFAREIAEDSKLRRHIDDSEGPLGSVTNPNLEALSQPYRFDFPTKISDYQSANVCQDGICSCAYTKATYTGGVSDYWPSSAEGSSNIPDGICSGPPNVQGRPCNINADCKEPGTDNQVGQCMTKESEGVFIGQHGFCLEYDYSRPLPVSDKNGQSYACLTWLPINTAASGLDVYNLNRDAGYNPGIDAANAGLGGQVYCAAATNLGNGINQGGFGSLSEAESEYESYGNALSESVGLWPAIGKNPQSCFAKEDGRIMDFLSNSALSTGDKVFNSTCAYPDQSLEEMASAWALQSNSKNKVILRGQSVREVMYGRWLAAEHKGSNTASDIGRLLGFPESFAPLPPDGGREVVVAHPPRYIKSGSNIVEWSLNREYDYPYILPDSVSGRYIQGIDGSNWTPGGADVTQDESGVIGDFAKTNSYFYEQPQGSDYFGYDVLGFESQAEKQVTEDVLQEVCFVPVGFPGGLEGRAPRMWQEDFCINYNDLDKKNSDANEQVLDIPTAYGQNELYYNFYGSVVDGGQYYTARSFVLRGGDLQGNELSGYTYENQVMVDGVDINQIVSRYVMVGAKQDTANDKLQNILEDDSGFKERDVFSNDDVSCTSNSGDGAWFAIGMDFNARGDFLGYVSRYCNPDSDYGISFVVSASINTMCTEFAQVYEPGTALTHVSNKAWTDRIYNTAFNSGGPDAILDGELSRIMTSMPYGSVPITADQLDSVDVLRENRVFADANKDGVPFSCTGSTIFGIPVFDSSGNEKCATLKQKNYPTLLVDVISAITDTDAAIAEIQQFFANVFARVGLKDNGASGATVETEGGEDASGELTQGLVPPQVYSLAPSCFDATDEACDKAEKNNMSINGKNGDPSEPLIGENGTFYATMNFFAWADKNRMPVRRIIVNWDDGKQLDPKWGLYKNNKPECNGTTFGDIDRSCDEQYHTFTKNYVCTQQQAEAGGITVSDIENNAAKTELTAVLGLSESDYVCVYQPKVQVMDNWGWCTGSDCGNGENGGCYEDTSPGGERQCNPDGSPDFDPWIHYGADGGGQIIVIPK